MTPRLLKEFRAVIVPWVLFLASVSLLAYRPESESYWSISSYAFSYIFAFAVTAAPFVYEQQYRTETFLLSQPIPRSSQWRTKIGMTSILPISAILAALIINGVAELNPGSHYHDKDITVPNIVYVITLGLGAWGLGAVTPYYIRQPVSAFLSAALLPWVATMLLIIGVGLANGLGFRSASKFLNWIAADTWRSAITSIAAAIAVTSICLLLSFRRFSRMEIRE